MAEQLFQSAVVYQIRTSKMKKMHNLNIQTGIYKMPRTEPVWVGPEGLSEDESDRTFRECDLHCDLISDWLEECTGQTGRIWGSVTGDERGAACLRLRP